MSTNTRGCVTLIGIVLVAIFLCVLPPFVLLPQSGNGITMPVITVPGEPLTIFGIDTINTVLGMLLADVIVILLAVAVYFTSNGWTKKVPGRLQAFMEMIVGGWWGITKQMAPDVPKVRNILFPLTASILLFLLAANLGKLIPGVESVGFIECAHEDFNGHPRGV
ncbi:MAG: F0F1 ATP synthase subunit A, partial [Aggregatilineales bacterium]